MAGFNRRAPRRLSAGARQWNAWRWPLASGADPSEGPPMTKAVIDILGPCADVPVGLSARRGSFPRHRADRPRLADMEGVWPRRTSTAYSRQCGNVPPLSIGEVGPSRVRGLCESSPRTDTSARWMPHQDQFDQPGNAARRSSIHSGVTPGRVSSSVRASAFVWVMQAITAGASPSSGWQANSRRMPFGS
jgi:hypothetical protein